MKDGHYKNMYSDLSVYKMDINDLVGNLTETQKELISDLVCSICQGVCQIPLVEYCHDCFSVICYKHVIGKEFLH